MSSDFLVTTIGNTCEISTGFPFKSNGYCAKSDSIKLLRGDNIAQGSLRWDGVKRWNPEALERSVEAKYSLRGGDVVVAMDRPWIEAGLKFAAIQESDLPCLLVQRVACLRAGTSVDQGFLKYVVSDYAFTSHVLAVQTGTAVPHISSKQIAEYEFAAPPLEEQKAIAHILGTLDEKIELNRKTNETLEAMAKALFTSWFVDFDPVREKAEGRSTGLPAEISDLFPDSFEDSELGEIPSGWVIGTIGSIAQVIDCLHSKKPDRQENGKQLLQLNNIEDNGLLDQSQKYLISADDYDKWSSRIEVKEGDCVITNVGRVGAVAQIPKGAIAAIGRNMTAIRLNDAFPHPTFLLEYLLSSLGREEIRLNIDEGTILNALNVKSIPGLRFFRSSDFILNAYEKSARPLREAMEGSLKENQSLSALRDSLLPKLISGEIRIPDAERMLEEAGV